MKIQSFNYSQPVSNSSPAFNGNISKLLEVIPDTKVSKNLTELDKTLFLSYVTSKKYSMGVTPEDISSVTKYDRNEFISKSYDLLTQKLGIPEYVRPPVFPSKLPNQLMLGYSPLYNAILVDPEKIKNTSKLNIFGLLRHELQHFIQNSRIFRHEEIGEKAIDKISEKFVQTQKQILKMLLENNSVEKLRSEYGKNPEGANMLRALDYVEAKDEKGLEMFFNQMGERYKADLSAFRQNLILSMGLIKKDSNLTKKINADFNEFLNVGYFNPDGSVDYTKYFNTAIEGDAILAQTRACFEFSNEPCFMKYAKKDFFESLKDEQQANILESIS